MCARRWVFDTMESEKIYQSLPELLLPWYRENKRDLPWRHDREPYHVWVSEIMLQQTRVEAVVGYYTRFLQALPDIRSLAEADPDQLHKLWEGLGYYSRVRNLQKAAQQVMQEHGGSFPRDHAAIRQLAGIGPYTAGAIASICFELPKAAVDGNVLRILSRIMADDRPIDKQSTKDSMAASLEAIYPEGICGDFTQALMELGATVCTPRSPRCESCPVKTVCRARVQDRVAELPVKSPPKAKRIEQKTVFILDCGGSIALRKRGAQGLLAGLWELPNLPGHLEAEAAMAEAARMGAAPDRPDWMVERSHIFTHIRWELRAWHIFCTQKPDSFVWASEDELREKYALPTAFRQFFDLRQEE